MSMEEVFVDMEDGFLSGYEDYRRILGNIEVFNYRRFRERVKRKVVRCRVRLMLFIRKVDFRVY